MGHWIQKTQTYTTNCSFLQGDIAMSLDFDKDISPRIRFLLDQRIQAEDLGQMFSVNPDFFRIDIGKFQNILPLNFFRR